MRLSDRTSEPARADFGARDRRFVVRGAPVALFPPAPDGAPGGAPAGAPRGPTLAVMHLSKEDGDDDPFDPLQNAADGGFCAVMNPRYEPEQFDALVEFAARRTRRAMPAIREAIRERLRMREAAERTAGGAL